MEIIWNHENLPDRIESTDKLWHQLCAMLPTTPHEGYIYWASWGEEEILSADGAAIDRLADLFDDLYDMGTVVTGYYDPDDDSVGARAGYYYCTTQ